MQRVERLSDVVIDQIAAGEVVERPASALKELLENSLDAGAKQIKVRIEAGGQRLLEVMDDGLGMHPDDIELSLMRGATSKLRCVEDLNSICSLGFRGEALASISSVSKLTLSTRRQGDEQGVELYAEGGRIQYKRPCGMPIGTCVRVENLFFNVPARKHFLKKESTEAAHVQSVMRNYALAYPSHAFSLTHGGRLLWHVGPCNTLKERVIGLWGLAWADRLRPVEGVAFDLELSGLLGKADAPAASRAEQVLWLNGRPIEVSMVRQVLRSTGRHASPFFLHLKMDPALVDVNVHPTKREVRFKEAHGVVHFFKNCLEVSVDQIASPDPLVVPFRELKKSVLAEPLANGATRFENQNPVPRPEVTPAQARSFVKPQAPQAHQKPALPSGAAVSLAPDWKFVGLFRRGAYILWESDQGLVIMDVQASWSRIRMEQIKFSQQIYSQRLAVSETLALEPVLFQLLKSVEPHLLSSGFDLEPFGGNDVRVLSVPAWLKGSGADFLKKTLLRLQEALGRPEDALAVHVCLSQVAAEQMNAESERDVYALFQALWKTQTPTKSPKGTATFWVLTPEALQRYLCG